MPVPRILEHLDPAQVAEGAAVAIEAQAEGSLHLVGVS
jgi:hypothetical protein